jgi:hypothetical protein
LLHHVNHTFDLAPLSQSSCTISLADGTISLADGTISLADVAFHYKRHA